MVVVHAVADSYFELEDYVLDASDMLGLRVGEKVAQLCVS